MDSSLSVTVEVIKFHYVETFILVCCQNTWLILQFSQLTNYIKVGSTLNTEQRVKVCLHETLQKNQVYVYDIQYIIYVVLIWIYLLWLERYPLSCFSNHVQTKYHHVTEEILDSCHILEHRISNVHATGHRDKYNDAPFTFPV